MNTWQGGGWPPFLVWLVTFSIQMYKAFVKSLLTNPVIPRVSRVVRKLLYMKTLTYACIFIEYAYIHEWKRFQNVWKRLHYTWKQLSENLNFNAVTLGVSTFWKKLLWKSKNIHFFGCILCIFMHENAFMKIYPLGYSNPWYIGLWSVLCIIYSHFLCIIHAYEKIEFLLYNSEKSILKIRTFVRKRVSSII